MKHILNLRLKTESTKDPIITKYDISDFKIDVIKTGRTMSDSVILQRYGNLRNLLTLMNLGDMTRENLKSLVQIRDEIDEILEVKKASTKSGYYYALMLYCEIIGESVDYYKTKYIKNNNTREKDDTIVRSPKQIDIDKLMETLQDAHTLFLQNSKYWPEHLPMQTLMQLQNIILQVMYLKMPIYNNNFYFDILNVKQDEQDSYYDVDQHTININTKGLYNYSNIVPEHYWDLFDYYYTHASKVSKYFLFSETTRDKYKSQNYSNLTKKIFGVDVQTIKRQLKNSQ